MRIALMAGLAGLLVRVGGALCSDEHDLSASPGRSPPPLPGSVAA